MKKIINLIKNTVRSMRLSFRFAGWLTAGLIFLSIIGSVLPVWQAKIMGDIVNFIVESLSLGNTISLALIGYIALYAGIWAITRVSVAIQVFVDKVWTTYNEQGLEIMVLKKRTEIDLGHYENPDFQNLLHRAFNRGIWPAFELIELQIRQFGSIAVLILTSAVAIALSPLIYFITIITSIPMFIVNLKYGNKMWSLWAENSPRQRKYQHVRSHIQNRVGVTQTKLFQGSFKLVEIANQILSDFRNDQLKVDRANLFWSIFASIISSVGLGFSFYLIVSDVAFGLGNVGSMVFLISVLGQLVGAINTILADLARQFERNKYVEDIFTVLDTKPFVTKAKDPIRLNLKNSPTIYLRDVWFKYEGREDWILQNVNLVIHSGEKIALVGENGAGKSTLIKLLSRVYDPTKGEILVNGVNLKDIDAEEWGSYLAVLLQDYMNYDFTLAESIAMGRPENVIDREKVQRSVNLTGANEFIDTWENGIDQQMGKEFEGGIEPSKGQNQKIALSRTIYREGLVVILDEPTAAIDSSAETYIFEQMENATAGNTLIVVTHRFNTTQGMDTIVVMDKGTIVETGTHKELLTLGGYYYKMFETQAKKFREDESLIVV
jgi:ATP-binding cassette, subfamily B, bacterial